MEFDRPSVCNRFGRRTGAAESCRLLFLAHMFPPAGGGGVQRPAKFVKYLHRRGWQITVVTTQEDLYRRLHGVDDRSLLEEIPDAVEIRRFDSVESAAEPPRGLLAAGRLEFERWFASLAPAELGHGWPGTVRLLRRWWWARRAADSSQAWAERVTHELAGGIERWPVILATGSPFSTLLAGCALARAWQVPLVADLRDPWARAGATRSARIFGHRRLEARVLREAARIVVVTEGMRRIYADAYPALARRIEVIENGVDLDESWRREPVQARTDRFEVVYTGVLNEDRSPGPFFRAAQIACARSEALAKSLRIVMAGRFGTTAFLEREHRDLAAACGLLDRLELRGYLPHAEVVRLQRSAAVLLSIVGGGFHVAAGKSYEYLAAGRPVLALVPPGSEAAAVLRHATRVHFPPPDDPERIAGALLDLFSLWAQGGPAPDAPRIPEAMTREHQAGRLDALLRSVLAVPVSSRGGAGSA